MTTKYVWDILKVLHLANFSEIWKSNTTHDEFFIQIFHSALKFHAQGTFYLI